MLLSSAGIDKTLILLELKIFKAKLFVSLKRK